VRSIDRQSLLVFTVADRRLGLPLNDVRRVVPLPLLQPPTGAPAFVEGVFDFRGAPVAAIRIDRLLALGEDKLGLYSPLLLLKDSDPAIALHVGRVVAILKSSEVDVQPIGRDETFNACVVGRFSDRGETVYLLSTDNILMAEERAKVAAQRAMKRRRLDELAVDEAHAA
jgi:chemotaxis signal transduction protein